MTGRRFGQRWRVAGVALLALALAGCASSGAISNARIAYDDGHPDAALALIEAGLDEGRIAERDRLVGLLEAGMIAHVAGRIEDSIAHLRDAAELVERLDAVFIGEQAGTLIVNDRTARYRGEYAERLWIRTLQMLNYLVLDDVSGAAVEARQAIALYERHGAPLDGDVFSRTLAARMLDGVGEPQSAAIEYARAFEASGGAASVAAVALETAQRADRPDDAARYRDALARTAAPAASPGGRTGTLLLIVGSGRVPAKQAGNLFIAPELRISFPYYPSYAIETGGAALRIAIDGEPRQTRPVTTLTGSVAEASLAARATQVTARQTLRVVTKQGIAAAARREDELLGALVAAAFFLLEEADTRGWLTLPGEFAFHEIELPVGEHALSLASATGDRLELDGLQIQANRLLPVIVHERPQGWVRVVPRVSATD